MIRIEYVYRDKLLSRGRTHYGCRYGHFDFNLSKHHGEHVKTLIMHGYNFFSFRVIAEKNSNCANYQYRTIRLLEVNINFLSFSRKQNHIQ